jgi:hypothetical protein
MCGGVMGKFTDTSGIKIVLIGTSCAISKALSYQLNGGESLYQNLLKAHYVWQRLSHSCINYLS